MITIVDDISVFCVTGKISHAAVGRIALVMALAAASGGLTSTIVSGLVQVNKFRVVVMQPLCEITLKT